MWTRRGCQQAFLIRMLSVSKKHEASVAEHLLGAFVKPANQFVSVVATWFEHVFCGSIALMVKPLVRNTPDAHQPMLVLLPCP